MSKIVINYDYKIFDKLSDMQRKNPKAGPLGWVRAFMQAKDQKQRQLFFEGPNMVVAQGRYFVAQKILESLIPELIIEIILFRILLLVLVVQP